MENAPETDGAAAPGDQVRDGRAGDVLGWIICKRRVARSRGYCSSVMRTKSLYGSSNAYWGRRAIIDETLGLDRQGHGVAVHPQLCSDGAHLPVLGVKHPPNARAKLRRDHRATSKSWRRSANAPTPAKSRWRRTRRHAGTQSSVYSGPPKSVKTAR
jgi:hypothetical protein